jgi:hypothetical protein
LEEVDVTVSVDNDLEEGAPRWCVYDYVCMYVATVPYAC